MSIRIKIYSKYARARNNHNSLAAAFVANTFVRESLWVICVNCQLYQVARNRSWSLSCEQCRQRMEHSTQCIFFLIFESVFIPHFFGSSLQLLGRASLCLLSSMPCNFPLIPSMFTFSFTCENGSIVDSKMTTHFRGPKNLYLY